MELSELQLLFATKVAEQSDYIEKNYESVLQANSYINQANIELIKATKKGVDFRIFVLIFLIVCSLSLLFLHWIT